MVVAAPHVLVVGLGNLPYPLTRHSVGQLVVDSLASRLGIQMLMNRSLGGYYGHSNVIIGEHAVDLALYKPKVLMNISGHSVLSALRQSVKTPTSLIVIHDSFSHKPETISYKFGGSANGHNGVKSVIASLRSMEFHRFRIGIGRDESADPAEYVLSNLPLREQRFWGKQGEGIDVVLKEIGRVANQPAA